VAISEPSIPVVIPAVVLTLIPQLLNHVCIYVVAGDLRVPQPPDVSAMNLAVRKVNSFDRGLERCW